MAIKRVTWRTRLILILTLFVIVGFIPWEGWFLIEIKDHAIQVIADYALGFSALFLLAIVGFSTLSRRFPNVKRPLLYLLLPLILIGVLYTWFIFSFVSRWGGWEDYRIYRHGDRYLVLELYEAPGDMEPEYSGMRIVLTKSPLSKVRWNDSVYTIRQNKKAYLGAEKKLQFAGKTWYTVAEF